MFKKKKITKLLAVASLDHSGPEMLWEAAE